MLLNWKYCWGGHGMQEAHRLYRCEEIKAQKEVYTKRSKHGEWGVSSSFYFLDGNEKEFRSEKELLKAWRLKEGE